jgi:hypothetical protein
MKDRQTRNFINGKSISENQRVLIKNAVEMGEMFCNDNLFRLLEVREGYIQILKMRWKEKMTFEEIANVYNVSHQRVISLYAKSIHELNSNINLIPKNILTQKEKVHLSNVSVDTLLMDILPKNAKAIKLFHYKEIYTISDVLNFSKMELLRIPGIGVKTVWELENSLEENGYFLKK